MIKGVKLFDVLSSKTANYGKATILNVCCYDR